MGLLNAIPYAGYQSPWASLRQRYGQHESAHAAGGEGPKGPMPPAPDKAPSSFWDRLNTGFQGLESNPMFTMGLSLLGNAQNGGNWSGVLEDMQGMGDRRRQQQILDNEMRRQKTGDAREETRFGREQAEWQAEDRQRSAYDRYLPTVEDPELRGILEAVGADNYGQVLSDERRLRIQREEAERDRQLQGRLSGARAIGPAQARGFRNDYERAIEPLRDLRLRVEGSLPYARAVYDNGGRAEGVDSRTIRQQDAALVYSAARMINGPGILSDADIRALSSPSLAGVLNDVEGYLAENGRLSETQRYALAEVVARNAENIDRRIWETYDQHAAFAEEYNLRGDSAGIFEPSFARPSQPSFNGEAAAPAPAPSAPAPNQGGWGDFGRALGGLLGRPETPTPPAPTSAPFSSGSGFNDRPRRPPRVEGLPPIQNRRVGTRYTWTVNGRQVSGTWNGRGFD